MHVDLTSGKDNFRAQLGSPKRHVEVQLYVCPRDRKKLEYIYYSYSEKHDGLGTRQLLSTVQATSRLTPSPGTWYTTRYEMASGTLVVIELKIQDPVAVFGVETYYAVLIADENGALLNIAAPLPHHELADFHNALFSGRFHLIHSEYELGKKLSAGQREAIRKFFDVKNAFVDTDPDADEYTDLEQIICEEAFSLGFNYKELEAEKTAAKPAVTVKKQGGKRTVEIRRTRKLKL